MNQPFQIIWLTAAAVQSYSSYTVFDIVLKFSYQYGQIIRLPILLGVCNNLDISLSYYFTNA